MKKRIIFIDIMRGLGIIFMIQFHIYYHWIFRIKSYDIYEDIIFFFGSISTPFFIIISGTSFYLFMNKKINENWEKKKTFLEVLKRSLFIFTITTLFQVLFGFFFNMHISFIIYWSLFQVIALSMILFCFFPFLKTYLRVFLYVSLFLFIILLDYGIKFYKIELLYILVEGIHEFIPYANFFIFGLFLGDILINSSQNLFCKISYLFIPIGIIFLMIGLLEFMTTGFFMENDGKYYIMSLGSFLLLFSICYFLFEKIKINFFISKMISRWGKFSFSIYYIHFGIIAMGLIIFPLLINDLYSTGFLYYQFLIILLIIFVCLELFLRLWQKVDYIFGIEWFMNKISRKSLFSEEDEKIKS